MPINSVASTPPRKPEGKDRPDQPLPKTQAQQELRMPHREASQRNRLPEKMPVHSQVEN
jgi:hypothetical protein